MKTLAFYLVLLTFFAIISTTMSSTNVNRYAQYFGERKTRCPVCVDKSVTNISEKFVDTRNLPLIEFEDFWPPCTDSKMPKKFFYDKMGCARFTFYTYEYNNIKTPTFGIINIPFSYFKRLLSATFSIRQLFYIRSGPYLLHGQLCDAVDACFEDPTNVITYPPRPTTTTMETTTTSSATTPTTTTSTPTTTTSTSATTVTTTKEVPPTEIETSLVAQSTLPTTPVVIAPTETSFVGNATAISKAENEESDYFEVIGYGIMGFILCLLLGFFILYLIREINSGKSARLG